MYSRLFTTIEFQNSIKQHHWSFFRKKSNLSFQHETFLELDLGSGTTLKHHPKQMLKIRQRCRGASVDVETHSRFR